MGGNGVGRGDRARLDHQAAAAPPGQELVDHPAGDGGMGEGQDDLPGGGRHLGGTGDGPHAEIPRQRPAARVGIERHHIEAEPEPAGDGDAHVAEPEETDDRAAVAHTTGTVAGRGRLPLWPGTSGPARRRAMAPPLPPVGAVAPGWHRVLSWPSCDADPSDRRGAGGDRRRRGAVPALRDALRPPGRPAARALLRPGSVRRRADAHRLLRVAGGVGPGRGGRGRRLHRGDGEDGGAAPTWRRPRPPWPPSALPPRASPTSC